MLLSSSVSSSKAGGSQFYDVAFDLVAFCGLAAAGATAMLINFSVIEFICFNEDSNNSISFVTCSLLIVAIVTIGLFLLRALDYVQ